MERNLFFDIVKGITILNVIVIHTAFWAGGYFMPKSLIQSTLLIDVPVFFLLSGLTSSGSIKRNIKRLVNLQISYMVFISLVFVLCFLYYEYNHEIFEWEKLTNWYMHTYSASYPVYGVMHSMWFMKVYIAVSFIGTIILYLIREVKIKSVLALIFFLLVIYFSFISSKEIEIFSIDIQYLIFYLFIFLVGNILKKTFIKGQYAVVFLILLIFSSFFLYYEFNQSIFKMQALKLPPKFIYLIGSSFSLLLVLYLKDRVRITKNSFLVNLGQNSIFYYFAQGIPCSITALIINKIYPVNIHWTLLFIIVFCVNLIGTYIIVRFIKPIDSYSLKLVSKIVPRKIKTFFN